LSGFFDDQPSPPPRRPAATATQSSTRSRALVGTAIVLVAGFFVVSIFTGIWTDRLWYDSVGYSGVFSKVLGTRVLLFLVFALVMGLAVGASIYLAHRFRPMFRPASLEQANLDRYREAIAPLRKWLLLGVAGVLALFAGASGAGQWRTFLLWRNQEPFGRTDPYFGRDLGFFVFELPWLHYLVDFGMAITVVAGIAAAIVHYLFGGIRLQSRHDKLSGAAQVQLSVLLGLFVLFKAADYWLDRFDLASESGGLITGITYTDDHAVLPSKNILLFIALICALLFFANVLRRTWMLPSVGLALLALSAVLLGALWPGLVQRFEVAPSEADKEAPYIARNIEATRTAYNIDDVEVTQYAGNTNLSPQQLRADAASIPGIRLVDPAVVSETFEQLQQVRGYYSVPPVLDVDRYTINGEVRDMVVALREVDLSGLPAEGRNWANLHTVYTHGYGMIAAYGNQRNAEDELALNDGEPEWAEQDLPPRGEISRIGEEGYQARIYFGERSPNYSIVGREPGTGDVELDLPNQEDAGGASQTNTYQGATGVPVGGLFHQLLYAVKFSDSTIFLSSRVNDASRILYDRHPRTRVEKVAPWLTVDNDIYPAVVDGRIKWILDGYTLTDRYPNSEKRSFDEMTRDSLSSQTAYAALPSDEINYMRNSVKAVVDAYDGTVTLYQWNEQDPILQAWSSAFPGVVKPKETIPNALREHMRYPEDMFKVQRNLLAQYHVTQPDTWYEESDLWQVPVDPNNKRNYQPPYYLSVETPTGGPEPVFSLTSVFVPNNRSNLAAFISVDAEAAGDSYGKIRILRLPGNTQIQGPSQVANQFAADDDIRTALLPFTRGGDSSSVIYGNLLTLPVGDGLLYVQPVYTQRDTGAGSYPVLRYVLASFGDDVGYGSTLAAALDDVLGTTGTTEAIADPNAPEEQDPPPSEDPPGDGQPMPDNVQALLQQAEAKFQEAESALQKGDLQAYATAQEEARQLVAQALDAAGANAESAPPADDGAGAAGEGDAGGGGTDGGGADGGADAEASAGG